MLFCTQPSASALTCALRLWHVEHRLQMVRLACGSGQLGWWLKARKTASGLLPQFHPQRARLAVVCICWLLAVASSCGSACVCQYVCICAPCTRHLISKAPVYADSSQGEAQARPPQRRSDPRIQLKRLSRPLGPVSVSAARAGLQGLERATRRAIHRDLRLSIL